MDRREERETRPQEKLRGEKSGEERRIEDKRGDGIG